ncbi:MAG: hypothetical protein EHM22_06415 [Actinobacteria bacterium]|nr:MAG: hypothetical protein EHM22_06415 [Actinomycetota bacterium]
MPMAGASRSSLLTALGPSPTTRSRSTTTGCARPWTARAGGSLRRTGAGFGSTGCCKAVEDARSVVVTSATGYARRFPIDDANSFVLATRLGGEPLSAGHGFPARLVAPGRRGFWWVKWVERIEASSTPWWWQSPFPLT